MRVLVVDEDATVLNTCCAWLIGAGYEVSTQRTAGRLLSCIRHAQAEVALIEPLMNGLTSEELSLLLASCRHAGAPSVILHSRLRPLLLRTVVDPAQARGVIRKTDDPEEFLRDFRALTAGVWQHRPTSVSPSPAVSGTHRIDTDGAQVIALPSVGTRR
ncbi:MAG TPA: hypothetical protein VFQ35_11875 [Polyangiaceae bacterium]|nr:hypothetical protein [Polyangiaceae bacterium]